MTTEEIIELNEKVKDVNFLTDQIKRGENILRGLDTLNRKSQGFRIDAEFTYSSNSMYLSDQEFEVLLTVNKALLQQFVDKRKVELEKM